MSVQVCGVVHVPAGGGRDDPRSAEQLRGCADLPHTEAAKRECNFGKAVFKPILNNGLLGQLV